MLKEQQQQDIHILAILGTHKHYFKVRCNASSYTNVFCSVLIKAAPTSVFRSVLITHFQKNSRYSLQKESRLCETMHAIATKQLFNRLQELSTPSIGLVRFLLTNVGMTVVPACMCRPIIKFSQVVYIINPDHHRAISCVMQYLTLIPQALVPQRRYDALM